MVAQAGIWLDETYYQDFPAPAEPAELARAVQTQTAVHEALDNQPRPEPAEMKREAEEAQNVPANPEPQHRRSSSERRHLAGADWLADWTRYFPADPKPSKPNTGQKSSD